MCMADAPSRPYRYKAREGGQCLSLLPYGYMNRSVIGLESKDRVLSPILHTCDLSPLPTIDATVADHQAVW